MSDRATELSQMLPVLERYHHLCRAGLADDAFELAWPRRHGDEGFLGWLGREGYHSMLKDSAEVLFNAMHTRKGKGYETYVLGEFLGGD